MPVESLPAEPRKDKPNPGERWVYSPSHGKGFGEKAKGHPLPPTMDWLDIKPGQPVLIVEVAVSGAALVSWPSNEGATRTTTIDPGIFNQDFILVP
jgi:hypothetical protein